ncbi:MAG: family 20 glycosylhydrolase [Arachnia sp.]
MSTPIWAALPQPETHLAGEGRWQPGAVLVDAPEDLASDVHRLVDGFERLGPLLEGRPSSTLTIALHGELSGEDYRVEVADDVRIEAGSPAAAHRAAVSVLGQVGRHRFLPRGSFAWRPIVGERGVHLDAARKFYPAEWMHALLERMSSLGLNTLQWHFSENEGVRLASEAFPEIVSPEHLTRAQAREILAHAADLHIAVVPSLDMPGHLRQVLATRPELRLLTATSGTDTSHALDITNPAAVDFAKRLIDDYATLFADSTHWNLGGDEFVDFTRIDDYPTLAAEAHRRFGPAATGFDLLTDFVNEIGNYLLDLGFVPRAWNDGLLRSAVVELDRRVEITWWANFHPAMRPARAALDGGYRVLNFDDRHWYYVLGQNVGYWHPTAERAWADGWHPGVFSPIADKVAQEWPQPYPEQLLGSYFSIWSDWGDSESLDEVWRRMGLPLAAFAERSWNGGSELTFAQFVALAEASLAELS